MRFNIGEIVVDVVVHDDDFRVAAEAIPARARPPGAKRPSGPVGAGFRRRCREYPECAAQTYVLRVAGRTILVGTCIGEHKDRPEIPAWNQRFGSGFLDRLRRAGVNPASVDTVFCTHLHIDHVGWNTQRTDGRWAPTFSNARYLVGRTELADWLSRRDAGTAPAMHVRGLQDSVLPIMEAGLVDLVDDGHELARGLHLTLLPGHTVGQMGLRIDRPDGRAIFCGRHCAQPGAVSFSQACRPRPASIRAVPPRLCRSCSKKPQRLAGWWCRRTFAAGAGRMYANPAPFPCRSSGKIRDKSVRPKRVNVGGRG
jgi:glyoxylase-like metal-dependent hydrolase (beta-lactamase superfamily II)